MAEKRDVKMLVLLELIDTDDAIDETQTRGKTRELIKRWDEKEYFNNITELKMMENRKGFMQMIRMSYDDFKEVLTAIKENITPHQVPGAIGWYLLLND